jgi:hypothetical protein
MFVLVARMFRNGAACREYFQPEEKGIVPGVVFGLDGAKRALQYPTEEEAVADIPRFVSMTGHIADSVEVVPV